MAIPYEAAIHLSFSGDAAAKLDALIAKLGSADIATKRLSKSLEFMAIGGVLEKI